MANPDPTRVSGKCLCGAVAFSFPPPRGSAHCHCSMCREAHGAAFVTWVVADAEYFELEAGEDELRWYSSSAEAERGFCSRCGSTMLFRSTLCPGEVHVTRANLQPDDSEAPKLPAPTAHCFWDEHVSWLEVEDSLNRLNVDSPELERYKDREDYQSPER